MHAHSLTFLLSLFPPPPPPPPFLSHLPLSLCRRVLFYRPPHSSLSSPLPTRLSLSSSLSTPLCWPLLSLTVSLSQSLSYTDNELSFLPFTPTKSCIFAYVSHVICYIYSLMRVGYTQTHSQMLTVTHTHMLVHTHTHSHTHTHTHTHVRRYTLNSAHRHTCTHTLTIHRLHMFKL